MNSASVFQRTFGVRCAVCTAVPSTAAPRSSRLTAQARALLSFCTPKPRPSESCLTAHARAMPFLPLQPPLVYPASAAAAATSSTTSHRQSICYCRLNMARNHRRSCRPTSDAAQRLLSLGQRRTAGGVCHGPGRSLQRSASLDVRSSPCRIAHAGTWVHTCI